MSTTRFAFSIHTDSFNYSVTNAISTITHLAIASTTHANMQMTAAISTGCIVIGCYCAGSTSIYTNSQVASMSKLFVLVLKQCDIVRIQISQCTKTMQQN